MQRQGLRIGFEAFISAVPAVHGHKFESKLCKPHRVHGSKLGEAELTNLLTSQDLRSPANGQS